MESWATHLITFLIGTATGAAGNYFANKYTDQRRDKEAKKKEIDSIQKIIRIMPELIQEMKKDFNAPEYIAVRELVLLPNKKVAFNGGGIKRFIYYEDEHTDLRGKISILENYDFLTDITPGNAPIFRISEKFWNTVRKLPEI